MTTCIFAVWNDGEERLQEFLEEINSFHPSIKFTAEWSREISFLDTTVILDGNNIHTDLYTKPTDTHQYLSPRSCHPRHCTSSIPYSQSLRLRRICSRDEDFQTRSKELKNYLLARGYEERLIDQQVERAASIPRTSTLQLHPPQNTRRQIPLVVTYHPGLQRIKKILKHHLPMFQTD